MVTMSLKELVARFDASPHPAGPGILRARDFLEESHIIYSYFLIENILMSLIHYSSSNVFSRIEPYDPCGPTITL